MDSFNILFTSAGRRVALIRHFKDTLKALSLDGIIVTTDLQPHAPAVFSGDHYELVPRVTDSGYIPLLLEICKKYEIRLLIPLIDTELLLLSENRHLFEEIGVVALVCSPEANRICRDKNKTASFFHSIGIETPVIYEFEKVFDDKDVSYPLFVKPFDGSCSVGAEVANSPFELELCLSRTKNSIIQEYVEGEEYTVDVLVDFDGCVRSVVPRLRLETRTGEVCKGITVKNAAIIDSTKHVAELLPGALGCLTIQCFLTPDGGLKFIEINPRFGGGFPLSLAAGADFPRWIIEMMGGKDPEIVLDGWQDGVVMLRYDDAVFTTRDKIE